jgi:phage tail-like protein
MNSNGLGRYWFLDSVVGWRAAFLDSLETTSPDGDLVLDALPGSASLLLNATQQAAEFRYPTALCADGRGNLLVIDAALNLVKRIDLARSTVTTLPTIGGKGIEPRELFEPRGIAVLATGSVVIADTRNHHVKIFSSPTYTLLQDWGANNGLGQPEPGDEHTMFRFPWTVTAGAGASIYVVDRGNRRVQVMQADGAWKSEFSQGDWVSPTRMALGPNGLITVVDIGTNSVTILASGAVQVLSDVAKPQCVAVDDAARIYVGDAEGIIHLFVPDPNAPTRYLLAGAGMAGFDGAIVDLAWDSTYGLLAIVAETSNGHQQRLWKINPKGAPVHTGIYITQALDSGTPKCQWHRVLLNASLPASTSIQIDSFTAETLSDPTGQVTDPAFNQWISCVKSGADNPDCLVQSGPGRYLWLRLTFNSNGLSSPELRSIKVFYPRVSYLQYLPAIYQENETSRQFLERFLSIFQTEFDNLDCRIDRVWQLFNPGSIPAKYLSWLASWLGLVVDPTWSESKLRSILKNAYQAQCMRGTVSGLVQAIQDYAGVEAVVIEHFKLRHLPVLSAGVSLTDGVRLWGKDFYKRLQLSVNSRIGDFQLVSDPAPDVEPLNQDANQFTVLFLASPYGSSDTEQKVYQVVEREKPVHTQAAICPMAPRFRVGVQSTIGIDSVVGGINRLALNRLSTLGYDSILGCSPQEQKLHELGLTPRQVLGRSSRLS